MRTRPSAWATYRAAARRAFSLAELLVTMAVSLFVIGMVMATYAYSFKMMHIVRPKLSATDEARNTLSKVINEVRMASTVRVGSGSAAKFTEAPMNQRQIGNSIEVYSSNNTNNFVRYYWDPNEYALKRFSNADGTVTVMARYVTNQLVFAAEDYAGNVLTNSLNNRVIALTLHFSQIQHPIMPVGPGYHYEHYKLQTRITRRTLL